MSDEFSLLNHKVDVMNEVVTDMKASLKELTSTSGVFFRLTTICFHGIIVPKSQSTKKLGSI